MAEIIDGKAVGEDVVDKVKKLTAELVASGNTAPGLAVVIVGEDPASQVYVASKSKKAKDCGFHSVQHTLPAETSESELVELIGALNADAKINGILVQLPLPAHIDSGRIIQTIAPEKDVDGFHFINVGKLGTGELATAFVPCTPAGSMLLIERVRGKDLSGLNAVVVGRSNIVGKPMANLLLAANCTVTIAHSRTRDLAGLVPHRRHSGCRRRPAGDDQGRLGEARRHCCRCRHQPYSGSGKGRGKIEAGRRCRVHCGGKDGGRHHAGAGRRRPDDNRHADGQHSGFRLSSRGSVAAGILMRQAFDQPPHGFAATFPSCRRTVDV